MMQTGTAKHKNFESEIFADLGLYKVIETNKGKTVILHKDGSISMVTKFSGVNSTSFTEKNFEERFKRIQSTLDDLRDPRLSVQFVMVRDNTFPSLEENIKKLPDVLKPRAEYTKNLADEYKLFTNKFYVSVFCAPTKRKKKEFFIKQFQKLFDKNGWKFREYEKNFDADTQGRLMAVLDASDLLNQMLTDSGSVVTPIKGADEYYNLFQEFTRPSKSKYEAFRENPISKLPGTTKADKVTGYVKIDDSIESPRREIFSAVRASVGRKDFELDGYYHKIWSLDRAPKDWIFGKSIDVIESVPCEFIYSITFRLLGFQEGVDIFKGRLRDKRIIESSNQSALVEDLTKTAETQRVYDNFTKFAYGDAYGTWSSANLVIRIKDSILEKQARDQDLTREEMIQRLDQQVTKQVFARFGRSEWVNEESTSIPVFFQLIPGFSNLNSDICKPLFLSTSDLPYFIAMYENNRPIEHNGTNHFIDHRGNAVFFDIMDPSLDAWNYSISGQTGSGKSLLMNTFLMQQFADMAITGSKPVICILDVGGDRGSYKKIIEVMGGTEINLSSVVKPSIQMLEINPQRSRPTPKKVQEVADYLIADRKLDAQDENLKKDMVVRVRSYYDLLLNKGINNLKEEDYKSEFFAAFEFDEKPEQDRPFFKLVPGTCEPDTITLNLIMSILDVMLSSNIKQIDGFRVFDYDEVSQVLYEAYRRTPGRFPFLSDFLRVFEEIANPQDEESKRLKNRFIMKLTNWTATGTNPMFDKATTIDLKNDLLLADLKGLENQPHLQVVYTLLISQLFNDKMYSMRDRRKLMVRDEAWSVMKNDKARQYFVEDLRTARKNGFATISISQLPTDYLSPSVEDGKAIINQMQVQIFCKFGTEKSLQESVNEFGLTEEVSEQMRDLGPKKVQQADGSIKTAYAKFMMIMNGKETYVLYNILHPFEYNLYSSSAEDNAVIDYYLKEKRSYTKLVDVLWMMSRNEHIGDLELASYLEQKGSKNMALRVRGLKS